MSIKTEKKKKWAPVFEWSQNSGSKSICEKKKKKVFVIRWKIKEGVGILQQVRD